MKILMIGPFPIHEKIGLNGQSKANEILFRNLQKKHFVDKINSLKELNFEDKKEQGKFKLWKFIKIVFFIMKEIIKILKNNYDVMYITPGQSYLGFMRYSPYMIIGRIKGMRIFFHIHGGKMRKNIDKLSKFHKKLMINILKKSNGIIVLGSSLKNMFLGIIDDKKIYVCENGVESEIFATKKEIEEKIENYNENKINILYMSNLMQEKGILELLYAVEKLSIKKEIILNIAGAIEPSIKDTVESLLEKNRKIFIYHGIVSEKEAKKKLFLESDVFILPSEDEGQPLSILEAYSTGNIVIADEKVGGIKDIFKNEINGFSCKARNTEDIIEKINKIKNFKNISLYNYNLANLLYTEEKFSDRIFKIIKK